MVTAELRAAGVRADRAFENRSMKSQMKAADRSGAQLAVIIGGQELDERTAVVRPLRSDAEQTTVDRADLVATIQKVLS